MVGFPATCGGFWSAGVVLKHYSRVLAVFGWVFVRVRATQYWSGFYGEFGAADSSRFLCVFGNFWANMWFREFENLSEKPILLKNGLKNPLFGQNQLRINR